MLLGGKKPVVGVSKQTIKVSKQELFDLIGTNFIENYSKWSPEVKKLTLLSQAPLRQGSLLKQERVDRGHKSESTFKVSQFNPKGCLAFSGVSNAYNCIYNFKELTDDPGQTELEFIFEFPDLEMFMRPFEKLIRIAIQEGADRTARNIKRLAESGVQEQSS